MNLDDLKDQTKEQFEQASRKVQDSSLYIALKEKYDILSPTVQKVVLALGGLTLLFIVLLIPLSFLMSASDSVDQFTSTRKLTRDFIKTQRELKQGPSIPPSTGVSFLQRRVQSILEDNRLLEDQILNVAPSAAKSSDLTPKGIESKALIVELSKINLRQIVDIGYRLQTMSPSAKLTHMQVNANPEDDHYYDVNYEVTAYKVPVEKVEPENNKKSRKKRRRKRR